MLKEIQLTLYDIFGYLLPGTAILFAGEIIFWTLFWPDASLSVPSSISSLAAILLAFIAYLAGHLAQALGNVLEKRSKARTKLDKDLPLSQTLGELVIQEAVSCFGQHVKTLNATELFHLCDQALVHCGSLGEREIFTYREGFYRGNAVALAFVALAFVLRLLRAPAAVAIWGKNIELHRAPLALAAVLTVIGAWLCYGRFLRFAEHRYRSCFLRFLALSRITPAKVTTVSPVSPP